MSEKNVRVLNDLELSGGLTFTNNLSGFPENPKPRTLVVKGGVPYLYTELVDGSGYFSWTPIGYRQGAYVHSQGVASTLWTVSHNFNTVNFGYFVYDANHKMVVANVNVVDANTIQIELSEAITGTAVIFSTESIFAGVLSASTEVSLGNITLRDASGVLTVNNNAVAMKAALDAETAARTAADSAMSARIDDVVSNIDPAALDSLAEVVAAFQNTQGDVAASLANLSSSASSALADEISRATTAELTIASDLAAEVNRATQAEADLASQITAASYTLPAATASTLGGVKQGTNITIAADGTISAQTSAAATTPSVIASTTTVGDGSAAARLTTQASAASSVLQIVSAVNSAGNGGTIQIFATQATAAAGTGGRVIITGGGGGSTNGSGGDIAIQAGNSYGSASGQAVTIQGGTHAGSGLGGDLVLNGGVTASGLGGSVIVSTAATGFSPVERLRVTPTGALSFGSNGTGYGTSGQVLTSNGNAVPTWQTPSAAAAAAGSLTGSTLSANVTSSSLTSVGTLTNLTVTNPISGSVTGIANSTSIGDGSTNAILSTPSGKSTARVTFMTGTDSSGYGGVLVISPGSTSAAGVPGALVSISAGSHSGTAAGGDISIIGGSSNLGTGGSVVIYTKDTGYGQTERIRVTPTGALSIGGAASYGTSGQVLTSNGNAAPSWQTPSATGMTVNGQPIGYLTVPQNVQNSNYTLTLADSGKHLFTTVGAQTWTIPANASVAFPIGTAVTFVNQSAEACSIAITSDSMYLVGAGTLGTRLLARYGMATAIKVSATSWMISGNLT